MDEREISRQNADAARRELVFFLVFPFLFGAFATVLFAVVAALRILMSGGFGEVDDLLVGINAMVPVYFIIVLALFVGEGIYLICRKRR